MTNRSLNHVLPGVISSLIVSMLGISTLAHETDIWTAVEAGIDSLKDAINHGADINAQTTADEVSPLSYAVLLRKPEAVELLLEKGAKIYLRDIRGNTALSLAAFAGAADSAKILLNYGADPSVRNEDGISPLGMLTLDWNFTHWLLNDILSLSVTEESVAEGRKKIRALMIQALRTDTPKDIWLGIEIDELDLVTPHLESDLSSLYSPDGSPVLIAAVVFHRDEIVKALIGAGADIEGRTPSGSTSLLIAAFLGYRELVELLIELGADLTATDHMGGNLYSALELDWTSTQKVVELIGIKRSLEDIFSGRGEIKEFLRQREEPLSNQSE